MIWKNFRSGCLFVCIFVAACHDGGETVDAASAAPDAFVGPTDEEIIAGYEEEVRAYQQEAGMPEEWATWMIERKDGWSWAYLRGRRDHKARVYVRYEREIAYNPPWLNEEEHFAVLERLAELEYSGWDFTFLKYEEGVEAEWEGNNVVAVLGHYGFSNANGYTLYLVWEAIFAHEFGHALGLGHHYCGNSGADHCPDAYPPGEGVCIMDRNSVSFGPTEIFLLQLTGERWDDEIKAIILDINSRYPEGYE